MDITKLTYDKYPMNPINMDITKLNYDKHPMNPLTWHVNGFIGYLI
jgi:hypothetical protein